MPAFLDSSVSGPSPLSNISDNPAYLENFTLTASFEAKMQFPDGGIDESEDIHYLNTDNTLEAIWIWSRYYTLTRDNRYYGNISAAWNYSWAHPAWLETDSGRVYSCAWALKAEMEFRRAYDIRSNLPYANRCATYIITKNGWETNIPLKDWGKNDIRGLAAGNLYDWAMEQRNQTARLAAIVLGNATQAAITANSTWLTIEDWALAGGVAYWGIVHSTFREYPNTTWAEQYGALLKTNVTNPGAGAGNSQCGWYAWYALGHHAAWEATGNATHLLHFLNMTAWLLMQDGDGDGGIPTNFGEPDNTDESWVTSYRALNLGEILPPWHGQPPDPPVLVSAELTGGGGENVTITWELSRQDWVLGDVMRYDVYRGTIHNSSGAGYTLLAGLPSGTDNFTDSGAGVAASDLFYLVKAVDSEWFVSTDSNQAGKVYRRLGVGHHLLTAPLQTKVPSLSSILSPLSFDYARAYDAGDSVAPWKSYTEGRPHQSLNVLSIGAGFWVNVTAPSDFIVAGLVPAELVLQLRAGWNLVGYCSMNERNVGETLAGLPWTAVELFDVTAGPYYLRRGLIGDILSPGDGFWVQVSSDSALRFSN